MSLFFPLQKIYKSRCLDFLVCVKKKKERKQPPQFLRVACFQVQLGLLSKHRRCSPRVPRAKVFGFPGLQGSHQVLLLWLWVWEHWAQQPEAPALNLWPWASARGLWAPVSSSVSWHNGVSGCWRGFGEHEGSAHGGVRPTLGNQWSWLWTVKAIGDTSVVIIWGTLPVPIRSARLKRVQFLRDDCSSVLPRFISRLSLFSSTPLDWVTQTSLPSGLQSTQDNGYTVIWNLSPKDSESLFRWD